MINFFSPEYVEDTGTHSLDEIDFAYLPAKPRRVMQKFYITQWPEPANP